MLAQWIALGLASQSVGAGNGVIPFTDHTTHRTSEMRLPDLAGHWLDLGSVSDVRSIRLDFIRADVVVQASRSPRIRVRIDSPAAAHDLEDVSIRVERSGTSIELLDIYPAQTAYARMIECLPQIDGRGDFWMAASRLRVTVSAPVAVIVDGFVRDGNLRDNRRSLTALSPR